MRTVRGRWAPMVVGVAVALGLSAVAQGPPPTTPYPILFVTQVPVPADFTTIGAVFGNHRAQLDSVARGGDLWIRDPDGGLRNLTAAAGYGTTGFQGATAIAVREPSVHWSGARAVFSMVVGGTDQRYQTQAWRWQLYEITGLGPSEMPVITKVPNQPTGYNNVSPTYGTDDRILFTSDRPRGGESHLYPQLDEYEEAPVVSGIWSLEPASGDLFLVQHSPSGSFSPQVDSFGRVIYIRWDHLQRDQQADADSRASTFHGTYGTFNYADESAGAARLTSRAEVFPEPRSTRTDLLAGTNLVGHTFNDFFPWMVDEDGSGEETLNHVGRHEFLGYFDVSLDDDPNLTYHHSQSPRVNPNTINGFIQVRESAFSPGTYFGVDAPEFSTHASGQIISTYGPPGFNPDQMTITYVTHRDTSTYTETPSPNHSGLYRNPLPLSDGRLAAVHTRETRRDTNTGTTASPGSRYDFRLRLLEPANGVHVPGLTLTPGISKSVTYWNPDVLVAYSGPLWELDPVEVRPRARPSRRVSALPPQEAQILAEQGISEGRLEAWLEANDLALIVSHDVTARDHSDRQQPFNLRVAGGGVQTVGAPGKVYDVAFLQIFQADQIRGIGGTTSPRPGRRVLPQVLHDPRARNPLLPGAPAGSVAIAPDGSVAAFVPARRALSWQLTDPAGVPVVRERLWVTMRPGEVRVCAACHGANTTDQAGRPEPANAPQALRQLLTYWVQHVEGGGAASPVALTVARTGRGSGTVVSSPGGVSCGSTCVTSVAPGTTVTLAATPGSGSRFTGWAGGGCSGVGTCTVTVSAPLTVTATFTTDVAAPTSFTRYLAEGVASDFFDTRVVLANPGALAASTTVEFLREDGVVVPLALTVPPLATRTIEAGGVAGLPTHAFGAVVRSDVPLAVDRTVVWHDARGIAYGAHAETSVAGPAPRWYLAEGATHSGFDLFYLLQNPSTIDVPVRVRYLRPVGPPLEKTYTLAPLSRTNIWVDHEVFGASADRALASTDVSAVIETTDGSGVIVERAMYYTPRGVTFQAGHESAGVTTPSTHWYLAEGATGPFFDLFLLIANPADQPADVTVSYLLPDGSQVRHAHTVGPLQRFTIWVDQADPRLVSTAVSMVVTSSNGVPVVVERSMWWPGDSATWTESHNAPGATETGTAWAVADGEVSGPPFNRATYLLVANPGDTSAAVKVTLLFDDGAPVVSRTFVVLPNSRFGVSVRDEFPEALGKRFGALVESLGVAAAPIVVERAMYGDAGAEVWAVGTNVLATRLR
ncbi:hypothetical protein [Luteitalea sp.]|uniref:HzsA-related protein n=1 Tax=Luteitalea sp. TaxID=2004800 RepID=UPI0025BDEDB6|nr:hypothetical protein [Luteitalea sp.]